MIVFLREVGFSLSEVGSLVAGGNRPAWQDVVGRKLADLVEQERRLDTARSALEHALRCPAGEPLRCPRFWSIIEGRLERLSAGSAHARAH